jgi:hypothetical protein
VEPKDKTQWHKGRLCEINRNKKCLFINPLNDLPEGFTKRDVYLNPDNISKYVLPVKGRDTVEFVLGDRDKTRPMVRKVRISQYSPRTCQELLDYIKKFSEDLNSEDCKKVLMETLPKITMWSFLGSPVFLTQEGMSVNHH